MNQMKYKLSIPTQEVVLCDPYTVWIYTKEFDTEFDVKTHILQILSGLIVEDWCVQIQELLFSSRVILDLTIEYEPIVYINIIEQYTEKLQAVDFIFTHYVKTH